MYFQACLHQGSVLKIQVDRNIRSDIWEPKYIKTLDSALGDIYSCHSESWRGEESLKEIRMRDLNLRNWCWHGNCGQ